MLSVQVERLDHVGIVAGVCQEIGLATYLDGLAGPSDRQVSIGTATTAMILHHLIAIPAPDSAASSGP